MEKSCVFQTEGGIGKMIASTALVEKLKTLYEKVYVFSAYPDIFWGIADRSFTPYTPYAYDDYYKFADNVFFPSPYRDNDFRAHRINLRQSYFKCCGLKYNNEIPIIKLKKSEIDLAKKIKNDIGSFIIVQFHGGKNPYNTNQPTQKNKIVKDYPREYAEKLVSKIKEKFKVQVVNMHLPGENPINGTIELQIQLRQWFALLMEAETFIGIDSNLQHAAAALNKPGIVLWGGTDPGMFGYEIHKNITGNCENLFCTRPYFVPSSDIVENNIYECSTRNCMNISPDKVIQEMPNIKNVVGPKIKLDQHICNCKG